MEKQIKHAMTLGKFYPIHSGHYEMIHSASVLAEKVTVIVLIDTERELLIDFDKRVSFVQNAISKYSPYGELTNVCIVPVYHTLATNYESEDTWEGFCVLAREGIASSSHKEEVTHFVCGDNSYGPKLSEMLSMEYVDLDDGRVKHPVSATKIRTDALNNWDYINNDVKGYFCNRVVFLGAESTGTSTLVDDVLVTLRSKGGVASQARSIEEYGRKYIEDKLTASKTNIFDLDLLPEEIEMFAEKQTSSEINTAEIFGTPWLLCDTDALASQIWFKRYFSRRSERIDEVIKRLPKRILYVLTSMSDIPLEYDGTRDGDDLIRAEMENDFENELKDHNMSYIVVKGDRESRVNQVMERLMSL
jgi:NadR type nicotinamide-nucleotide adenylyltransferase